MHPLFNTARSIIILQLLHKFQFPVKFCMSYSLPQTQTCGQHTDKFVITIIIIIIIIITFIVTFLQGIYHYTCVPERNHIYMYLSI